MKTCSRCNVNKSLENFSKEPKSLLGVRSICKDCHSVWMKNYNARPDIKKKNRIKQRERDAKRKQYLRHGLNLEEYNSLYNKYNGRCWVCKTKMASVIDHDHECCKTAYSCGSCVRGLLCRKCNIALGLLEDNVNNLASAIFYLSPPLAPNEV